MTQLRVRESHESPIPTLFPYLPAALFLDPGWPVAKSLPDWSNLKTNTLALGLIDCHVNGFHQ